MKKNENELSDAELQRKRVQIFDPPKDLQWYQSNYIHSLLKSLLVLFFME